MCDYTKHEYCDTLDNKMILVASDSNANAQEVAYLHIEALINQIEERSRSGRKIVKKTLLIFDGFFSGSSFNKVPVLKKLFLSSRRLNITIISSIDRFFQLPPCIRSSVDYLMFVGTMNHQEVHNICNHIEPIHSKNYFEELMCECSLKWSGLIVSQREKQRFYRHVDVFTNTNSKIYKNQAFDDVSFEFC